jgi:hypothetical protein
MRASPEPMSASECPVVQLVKTIFSKCYEHVTYNAYTEGMKLFGQPLPYLAAAKEK